jgi:hypothetical protein
LFLDAKMIGDVFEIVRPRHVARKECSKAGPSRRVAASGNDVSRGNGWWTH